MFNNDQPAEWGASELPKIVVSGSVSLAGLGHQLNEGLGAQELDLGRHGRIGIPVYGEQAETAPGVEAAGRHVGVLCLDLEGTSSPCRARVLNNRSRARARQSSRGGSLHRPGARRGRRRRRRPRLTAVDPSGRDLGGMDVEPLGQLGERTFVSNGGQGDLRLEGRGVIATGTFRHRELLGYGEHVAGGARRPLSHPVQKTETTS